MLKDKEIQQRLRGLHRIPTLMDVGRILRSFTQIDIENSPEVEREVIFIISYDPALTFNTLRMANSAYYGLARKISDIREAISVIGFSDLAEYLLKPATKAYLPLLSYYDWRELWFHSLAAAITAEYIARFIDFDTPKEAFTAALIHDIGKIVEFLSYPEVFREVIGKSNQEWKPFFEIEREITGIDHAFLGGFLARMWRFPYEYIKSIELHHDSNVPHEFYGKKTVIVSTIVMLSNEITKYYGFSTPGASFYNLENEKLMEFLGLKKDFIEEISFNVRKEATVSLERIGISSKV